MPRSTRTSSRRWSRAATHAAIKNVGVFTELDVDKKAGTSAPKPDSPVWVLIPHSSFESFVSVGANINTDPAVQKAGAAYLAAKKAEPAFDRIDAWLLLAFAGMPKLELPAFSKTKTATRIFEMRDYESHSELKALSKMAMFNDGEIDLMKDLGMSPVFFGQALRRPRSASSALHDQWTRSRDPPRELEEVRPRPALGENEGSSTVRGQHVEEYRAVPRAKALFRDLKLQLAGTGMWQHRMVGNSSS